MVPPEMQALNLHENLVVIIQPVFKLVERTPAVAKFCFCSVKHFALLATSNRFQSS